MTEGEKSHSDRPRDQADLRTLKNIQLAAPLLLSLTFVDGVVVCHQKRCHQKSKEDYTPKV